MVAIEFEVMGDRLLDIAMRERLALVNAYMADFDDTAWIHCFDSPKDVWSFLGPLYEQSSLRKQLPVKVSRYLEQVSVQIPH